MDIVDFILIAQAVFQGIIEGRKWCRRRKRKQRLKKITPPPFEK